MNQIKMIAENQDHSKRKGLEVYISPNNTVERQVKSPFTGELVNIYKYPVYKIGIGVIGDPVYFNASFNLDEEEGK